MAGSNFEGTTNRQGGDGTGNNYPMPEHDPFEEASKRYRVMQQGYPVKTTYDPKYLYDGRTEVYPQGETGEHGEVAHLTRNNSLMALKPTNTPEYVLGEYFHVLAKNDPRYKVYMDEFTKGGPWGKKFHDFELRSLALQIARNNPGRPAPSMEDLERIYDQSGKESWVRGVLLPKEFNGEEWLERAKELPGYQRHVLEQLRRYLFRGPGDYGEEFEANPSRPGVNS